MQYKEYEKFKDQLITSLSDNDTEKDYLINKIKKINYNDNPKNFYSKLLKIFVHIDFEEKEAKIHWEMIMDQYNYLSMLLKRNTGIRMAILDYFINISKIMANPLLVEIHVFRQTEKLAMIDALTNLFNRRFFDISIKKEFKRAIRYKTILSFVIIDLDDFKKINDTKGHLFGDMVLKNFAKLLNDSSREEDIVCRYGGEEFVIILPNISPDGALNYIERKRKLVKNNTFFSDANITFSAGIASYPENCDNYNDLLKFADIALYQAKYEGKDKIIIYKEDSRRERRFRLSWNLSYKIIDNNKEIVEAENVITQDVSLGGLKFETSKKLELGTKMILFVNVLADSIENGLNLLGETVWVRALGNNKYNYGIKFYDLLEEQKEQLKISLPASTFLEDLTI